MEISKDKLKAFFISGVIHLAIFVSVGLIGYTVIQTATKKEDPIIPDSYVDRDPQIINPDNVKIGRDFQFVNEGPSEGVPTPDNLSPIPMPMPPTGNIGEKRIDVAKYGTSIIPYNGTSNIKSGDSPIGMFDGIKGKNGKGSSYNRIVFVIDTSGSLIDTIPFVLQDLKKTIERSLDKDKQFNVILFSGGQITNKKNGINCLFSKIQKANPDNIRKSGEFLTDVEVGGQGNALQAIKTAFGMNPDLVYLLSDNITSNGLYEIHQDKFIEQFKKNNKNNVVVNTIQFVYQDPLTLIGKQPTLKKISDITGGNYKFVTSRQLGLK